MKGNMKGILYSICIGSLALALTAWGEQASDTTTVKAKAKKQAAVSAQATTSAKTGARTSGNMAGTRFHRNTSTSANTRIRAHNDVMVNRQRERNIAMNERVKARENANVRNKTNVHANVNVNDTTRFTKVTRITSNGRTFNRAVFRDRNDRHFHLGFHDRIFFINNFSEVILINGCSFFLDEGIFWPAFIIGENCVPPRNVVFVAVD
jgi:lipopolysaccharide export LptBFGC system permease protein LptF